MTDAPINTLLSILVDKYGTLYPFSLHQKFYNEHLYSCLIVVSGWFGSLASGLRIRSGSNLALTTYAPKGNSS